MALPCYEELQVTLEQTIQKLAASEQKLRELRGEDPESKPVQEEPEPVKQEKVVIKTCHHIKESGYCCGSPAMTDRDHCHFHLSIRGRRLKMARARARRERWLVHLPPLEDLYAVQTGIQHVLDALASGQLDRRLGGTMLYGLQQATSNLCRPVEVWEQSGRFDNVGKVTWPGFEREHGLPEGFDVNTPPDVAFPPPVTSPAATELADEDAVTEDDIELEELLARDPEECKRRTLQLARKYRRRLRHEEEKLARACRILEAARRNAEARKKEPARVSAAAVSADGAPATVAPNQDALAIGGVAKKSPEREPDKKDERTKGAS